jgi:hypothetical protein
LDNAIDMANVPYGPGVGLTAEVLPVRDRQVPAEQVPAGDGPADAEPPGADEEEYFPPSLALQEVLRME